MMLNLTKLELLFYLPIFWYTFRMRTCYFFLNYKYTLSTFNKISNKPFTIEICRSLRFLLHSIVSVVALFCKKTVYIFRVLFHWNLLHLLHPFHVFVKHLEFWNTFFSISALPSLHNLHSLLSYNSLVMTQLLSFYLQRIMYSTNL